MFYSSLPPVVVGGLLSYLSYLCFFAYSGVQHILCCVLWEKLQHTIKLNGLSLSFIVSFEVLLFLYSAGHNMLNINAREVHLNNYINSNNIYI
jgi:hypothetical protein